MPDIRFDTMQPTEVLVKTMADTKTELETDIANAGGNLGEGKVFYCDSVGGSDTNDGTTAAYAVATIDTAIGLCTADRGDVIYLLQGHAGSSTTAADVATLDVDGVTIIGLGRGAAIPTFTLGHADATFTISAVDCRVSNIKIISDVADCAAGITLAATALGTTIDNCIFTDGAAAKELVIGVLVGADCDNCKIIGNDFLTVDGGGCASAIKFAGASDKTKIKDNVIFGDYSAACMDLATAASTQIVITDNLVRNADTTASFAIDLHASSTGWVARNLAGTEGGAHGDAVAAADMSVAENYASGADGASGILEPAADS